MDKLELSKLLQGLNIRIGKNAKYSTSDILSMITLGIISGQNRISKIEGFSRDPLIREVFGIEEKIDEDTIANRIKRVSMLQTTELMDVIGKLSNRIHKKLGTESDILDMDSSVRTVFGNQEGAEKGYNHEKKGARSYHPLMAYLNSTKECLLSWLRPGDSYTSNNAAEFIKQAIAMLPSTINELIVRADSGFFDDELLTVLESYGYVKYLIKVKLKNLEQVLSEQQWYEIPGMPGWQMADFDYRCANWKRSRRFAAIRKEVETGEEGAMFSVPKYDYFCYVTNIYESPLYLHDFYGDRGTSENWIEALKNQMYAGCLLTQDFWANEALWLLSVLAYNIVIWLRKFTDAQSWREEPATFRSWFVQLAGKLVASGRNVYLKMYEAYYYKERWRKIEAGINELILA